MVDAHSVVLVEVAGAIVPPRVAAPLRILLPIVIYQSPAAKLLKGFALRGRDVCTAMTRPRVPHVDVFGCDVEVAAHRQGFGGVRGFSEPAGEALEPDQLGNVEW